MKNGCQQVAETNDRKVDLWKMHLANPETKTAQKRGKETRRAAAQRKQQGMASLNPQSQARRCKETGQLGDTNKVGGAKPDHCTKCNSAQLVTQFLCPRPIHLTKTIQALNVK